MGKEDSPEGQQRIAEHFITRSAFNSVKELAERHGTSVTAQIHTAIATASFFYSEVDKGGAILIEKDGRFAQMPNPDSETELRDSIFPETEGQEPEPMDFRLKFKINPQADAVLTALSNRHLVSPQFELNRALLLSRYLIDQTELRGNNVLREDRDGKVYEVSLQGAQKPQ